MRRVKHQCYSRVLEQTVESRLEHSKQAVNLAHETVERAKKVIVRAREAVAQSRKLLRGNLPTDDQLIDRANSE